MINRHSKLLFLTPSEKWIKNVLSKSGQEHDTICAGDLMAKLEQYQGKIYRNKKYHINCKELRGKKETIRRNVHYVAKAKAKDESKKRKYRDIYVLASLEELGSRFPPNFSNLWHVKIVSCPKHKTCMYRGILFKEYLDTWNMRTLTYLTGKLSKVDSTRIAAVLYHRKKISLDRLREACSFGSWYGSDGSRSLLGRELSNDFTKKHAYKVVIPALNKQVTMEQVRSLVTEQEEAHFIFTLGGSNE